MKSFNTASRLVLKATLFGAMSVFAAGCSSCTDEPVNPNGATMPMENRDQEERVMPPANSKLEHTDPDCLTLTDLPCTDDVTFNGGRKLQVRLVDGTNTPASNVNVKFEITENDAVGSALAAANAGTNELGIAETNLRAGTTAGTVTVKVSTDDPNVNTLSFLVSVNPKDAASFNVDFTQVGNMDIKDVDVFLFDKDVSCNDFLNNARTLTAEFNKQGEASANGDLPTVPFSGISNGTTYTVGARAYDRTDDRIEVSVGCMPGSMNPAVTNGMPANVTVPLVKHIPYMVGDYDVVHTFNLVDAFPPNIARIVNLIGTLVSDQGAFIVGCEGEEDPNTGEIKGTDDCPVPTEGIAKLLIDFLPEDGTLGQLRDTIESFLDSSFSREIARQTINDAVEDFINTNSNVPSWVKDGLSITEDVYSNLKSFRVEASLQITEQPIYITDASGLPMADADGNLIAVWETPVNEHIWEDIILYWRLGCEPDAPADCGQAVFLDPNDVSTTDAVEGNWSGSVIGGTQIVVNEHALSFNYGTFILQLLERLVLPQLFGDPAIDSVEDALDSLIDCPALAKQVADATISGIEGIFDNLCVQLKGQATDALRGYVEDLVFDGEDRFTIGTPQEKGCDIYYPEMYPQTEWTENGFPLPYTVAFGKETPNNNRLCDWDVKVKLSSDGDPVRVDGTWTGVLK